MATSEISRVELNGDKEYAAKRFSIAVGYYQRVLEINPTNFICRLKLARALFFEGDEMRAVTVLWPVFKEGADIPNEFAVPTLLILLKSGLFRKAENLYRNFTISKKYNLKEDAEGFENKFDDYWQGCSHFEQKNWDQAICYFSRLEALVADVEALVADSFIETRRWSHARRCTRRILRKNPDHLHARYIDSLCEMVERDEEGTTCSLPLPDTVKLSDERHSVLLAAALKRRRQQLERGINRVEGIRLFEEKDYIAAIKSLTRVIDKAPYSTQNVDALLHRAKAHIELENLAAAAEDLKAVQKIAPDDKECLALLLSVAIAQGNLVGCQGIIHQLQGSNDVLLDKFRVFQSKYDAAVADFRSGLYGFAQIKLAFITNKTCTNAELCGMLAVCYYKNGNLLQVEEWARKALALNPNDLNGIWVSCKMLLDAGNIEAAFSQLSKSAVCYQHESLKCLLEEVLQLKRSAGWTAPPPSTLPPRPSTSRDERKRREMPGRPHYDEKMKRPRPMPPRVVINKNKNFFEILGVHQTASASTIKKAVHNLLKQCHPDKCEGDKAEAVEQTQFINQMKQTLLDDQKRREYTLKLNERRSYSFDLPRY